MSTAQEQGALAPASPLEHAQYVALRAMRHQVAIAGLTGEEVSQCSESDLLRFLRVRCLDVNAAAASFADYRRWREHFCVDQLSLHDVQSELKKGVLSLRHGTDRHGQPIVVVSMKNSRPADLHMLDFSMAFTYLMERALRSSLRRNITANVGILVDYSDADLTNCDLRVLRLLMDMCQNRYPEQVHYIMMCDRPPFFKLMWDELVPYIEPCIMSKVHVLPKMDCLEKLLEHIELAQIPSSLGGREVYNHARQMAQWSAQENPTAVREPTLNVFTAAPSPRQPDSLSPSTIADAPTTKAGFMIKQGGRVKTWKKRYFVLTNSGQLQYFKSAKVLEPQGRIILTEQCRAGVDNSNSSRAHTLALETPDRTWYFTCTDDADMNSWVNILNQTVVKVRSLAPMTPALRQRYATDDNATPRRSSASPPTRTAWG